MSSTAERRISPMRPRRAPATPTSANTANQDAAHPTDMMANLSFCDQNLDSDPSPLLTPPREGRVTNTGIRFGATPSPSNGLSPFTFGQLYNITPLPSPRPSPEPPSRREEEQLRQFSLSPQRDPGAEMQGNNNQDDRISVDVPTWSFAESSQRPSDVSAVSANATTSPYDVNSEEAPVEPFFDPRFQATLMNGIDLAQRMANAMAGDHSESEQDSDLNRLRNDANRLRNFQTSDTRTVAVLGDSGQGKSSLINSLLHCQDIARTGDIGTACTSVVTEYHQKTREHQAPITIQVEYLSGPEIEDLIKELVWSYRQLYLPNVEQEASDEDYKRYQAESERAWSALEAAFRHRREFRKEFLRDQSAGAADRIIVQILDWTKDLDWPAGGNNGVWKSTAETAEECCEKTAVFMRDKLWPFTKIIRVYLSAQVLKTGIVLADLPGLQDTNLARVRATEQYLLKCDHILIVAGISRAISDQSLKSSLYKAISQYVPHEWETSAGKYLNDINVKSHRKEFCGVGKRISPDVMAALDQQIEQTKTADNKILKKQLKRRQELLLIEARNDFVKEGLKRSYSAKVPGGKLEVFCVSNVNYEKFSKKGPVDFVNASGIPALRRFCHTITAKPQYLEAKHFLQSSLPSLLTSIRLWVEKRQDPANALRNEAKHKVFEAFGNMCKCVKDGITRTQQSFEQSLEEQLLRLMENRNEYWERAAEQKSNEWNHWHTTQYNAWCRKNGTHYTEKRGYVCWNSEIIWKMKSELDYAWDILEEEIPELFADLARSISDSLTAFEWIVKNFDNISTFADGIPSRTRDITYILATIARAFGRGYKGIRRNASEHNFSSYALHGMLPAYRTASQISGTGRTVRQQQTVQGRITNGNLFPFISLNVKTDVEQLISTTFAETRTAVTGVLGLMRTDLAMVYGEFPYEELLDGGSDGVHRRMGSGGLIDNGRIVDNRYRITENNNDEVEERIKDIKSRLADQLDSFERELGDIQLVISSLASDARESAAPS